MSQSISELVDELRHPDAGDPERVFTAGDADGLLEKILSIPRHSAHVSSAPPRARRRTRLPIARTRRAVLIAVLAACLAAAVLASLDNGTTGAPPAARAAIAFHTAPDADIIATVTDPYAAKQRLQAAFAQHGLDITLTLLPVAPSLVGTVVYTSGSSVSDQIQPLTGGHCVTGGGGCPIGLRISSSFRGRGYIALGRAAKPGEQYESQASAFAPGESLHCSGLAGARVIDALPRLGAGKLKVTWRQDRTATSPEGVETATSRVLPSAPTRNYIWEAVQTASNRMLIWTEPTPPTGENDHRSAVDRGCSRSH